ncbi:Thioredoxin domain protein, DsbA family [Sulfitobacter noctilucicola]|uniref:Putative DsbA family dithiol-disulfide isomerase n=1 Tax=Sulfitobacter noctilucicola TaxID=1342301 RepID=A0A7W6MAC3_9RHOB|nr:DsbA family oxidoreductase [Sulfitobacter noctilucicola]KIN64053.1 Thioredoxin domain protein, DsbA family [Sulfitobacter noctilucicola]MBB4175408.1 putative DsbA family dithiol-disulfide isomerase [Sulfitobacter noctilucicola]
MSDATPQDADVVQIDIVSDVMCPWCIVGFKQLEQALGMTGTGAYIRWHPFELNPAMPPEGQNLREHIVEKYGSTPEQSDQARTQLQSLGKALGIDFAYSPDSRIVNTFTCHQLLGWAQTKGMQHPLKMALFDAHFTQGRDVSDVSVLLDIAASVGLDRDAAHDILKSGSRAEETRAHQHFWTSRGVSGVPSMVFDGRYMLTGAQGAQTYAQMLEKIRAERAAA